MFQKAKIFNNGHSQAVRLPKEFRFESKEVIIRKVENGVLLMSQDKNIWKNWFDNLEEFSEDFAKVLDSREINQNNQKREDLF
ncbi:AbrB/MazE/SpoVT family DNA-binding domain-containing protein [Brachyspira aalborgi]|uniref:AbrB/MazE/SpoVT family DNA-binding domain-containing protein n=1 Tax=Brachyspira aalborgi TaxID=29522 RepID=A0A5C8D3A5_9SPIR|nr:type II toxin-antitoxin system VapB family antitoxin [Brachyspira aalborgi]TXJ19578.1 AbrB/MazE/SpoVT family DNA-binding domain-containing protein [Brachyspira aalborgi]